MVGAVRTEAVPILQLDVIGGTYDPVTETIVSSGPSFTLVALLTPGKDVVYRPGDVYYISAALMPQSGPTDVPDGSAGYSYGFTGSTVLNPDSHIAVSEDMEYGTPPLETLLDGNVRDPHDLQYHSVYPTFFNQFGFTFSGAQTREYDSQLSTGLDPALAGGTGTYYATFQVNLSQSLASSVYSLHFDLYDSELLMNCSGPVRRRECSFDIDVDHFAPFSHDASSGDAPPPPPPPPPPPAVPEPATLLLLGSGVAMTALARRRNRPTE